MISNFFNCCASPCFGKIESGSQLLKNRVIDTIQHAKNIPGLNASEFETIKPRLLDCWNTLSSQGVVEVTGSDKDVRPTFVTLQGVIEHVLASELNKTIFDLKAIIHTPMPPTPLCTTGEISPELMHPKSENDPLCVFTVKARTTIIRDFLYKGGLLVAAYPKDGINKRSDAQQSIYRNELMTYPTRLMDAPLNCESMDRDLIGALYLFKDKAGKEHMFAISIPQVNDSQESGTFGLWFGEVAKNPKINDRIGRVMLFMQGKGPRYRVLSHQLSSISLFFNTKVQRRDE